MGVYRRESNKWRSIGLCCFLANGNSTYMCVGYQASWLFVRESDITLDLLHIITAQIVNQLVPGICIAGHAAKATKNFLRPKQHHIEQIWAGSLPGAPPSWPVADGLLRSLLSALWWWAAFVQARESAQATKTRASVLKFISQNKVFWNFPLKSKRNVFWNAIWIFFYKRVPPISIKETTGYKCNMDIIIAIWKQIHFSGNHLKWTLVKFKKYSIPS
jgi:hypothetical protein